MVLYGLYAHVMELLFGHVGSIYYLLETCLFMFWSLGLIMRSEIKQSSNINYDNILLAFYKGDNGSFIMKISELFGRRVKSMCIIGGDHVLHLRQNKKTFQFGSSDVVYRKYEDYIIHDTGVLCTEEFVNEMKRYSNKKAAKGVFRIRCIEGVKGLLAQIDPMYKPTKIRHNIPSRYLIEVVGQ